MTASNNPLAQKIVNVLITDVPAYTNNIFKPAGHPNTNTKTSFLKLNQPLRKTNHGQKALSYLAQNIWNSLPNSVW